MQAEEAVLRPELAHDKLSLQEQRSPDAACLQQPSPQQPPEWMDNQQPMEWTDQRLAVDASIVRDRTEDINVNPLYDSEHYLGHHHSH